MNKIIEASIAASIAVKQAILMDNTFQEKIEQAARACIQSFREGGKVLFCGNGGSAADAQHIAAELSGRFYFDRPPLFTGCRYLAVYRDGRDALVSWANHRRKMRPEVIEALNALAARDGIAPWPPMWDGDSRKSGRSPMPTFCATVRCGNRF